MGYKRNQDNQKPSYIRKDIRRFDSYLEYFLLDIKWPSINLMVTFCLSFTAVLLVSGSIRSSNWVPMLPGYWETCVIAGIGALLLSGLRNYTLWPHLIFIALSGSYIWLMTMSILDTTSIESQILTLGSRFHLWWDALINGGASTDRIPFVLIILFIVWIMCYVTIFLVIKSNSIYSMIPSGFVLVTNLTYLPEDSSSWLFAYLFIVGLLFSWFVFLRKAKQFTETGTVISKSLRIRFMYSGVLFSTLIIWAAFISPSIGPGPRIVGEQWNNLRAPLGSFEGKLSRIFASLPARRAMSMYSFERELPFRGNIILPDNPVMSVKSDKPFYWRARNYDVYNRWGWSNGDIENKQMNSLELLGQTEFTDCAECIYNVIFEVNSPTQIVFSSGKIVRTSLPGSVTTLKNAGYNFDLVKYDSKRVIHPNESYMVQIYVPQINQGELENASTVYPEYINNNYMDLPDNYSMRVNSLAKRIVEDSLDPYSKSIAIRDYLRSNYQYSQSILPPPPGQDGIEYFLYVQKKGYSDYFASAMAVMLRSLSIPSRLSVGYINSEYDGVSNRYNVTEAEAHAWPEVYFPGYGWIPFEPTPGHNVDVPGGAFAYGQIKNTPDLIQDRKSAGLKDFQFEDEGALIDQPVLEINSNVSLRTIGLNVLYIFTIFIILFLTTGGLLFGWYAILSKPKTISKAYMRLIRVGRIAGVSIRDGETARDYTIRLSTYLNKSAQSVKIIGRNYGKHMYNKPDIEKQIDLSDWNNIVVEVLKILLKNPLKRIISRGGE